MSRAHIIEGTLVERDGYFTAHLDNGMVCIGLVDVARFDFPDHLPEYKRVENLQSGEFEAAFDEFFAKYLLGAT